jgi:hypothetical protein
MTADKEIKMKWFFAPGYNMEHLGLIPSFMSDDQPGDPVEQIDKHYQQGGGWFDFYGFKVHGSWPSVRLKYPEDPPILPIAFAEFKVRYWVVVFEHAWVGVYDKVEDKYRIARID